MRLTITLPVLFAFVSAAFVTASPIVEEVCIPIVGSGCVSILTVHHSESQVPALPDGSESSLPLHPLQAGAAPKL
ncbi:hypothetical protein EDD18DRAFT_1141160, partial [Armillaria luteobubalina]